MTSKITSLPDTITFLSTGEEVEIGNDVYNSKMKTVNGRRVMVRTKSSSATYTYTKVPFNEKSPSKKLGQTVDLSIEYVQRLDSFGLIKFEFKNEIQE